MACRASSFFPVHECALQRMRNQVGTRSEMPVEAPVREVHALHQLADAQRFESFFADLCRSLGEDAIAILCLVCLRMAHGRFPVDGFFLTSGLYSSYFSMM